MQTERINKQTEKCESMKQAGERETLTKSIQMDLPRNGGGILK